MMFWNNNVLYIPRFYLNSYDLTMLTYLFKSIQVVCVHLSVIINYSLSNGRLNLVDVIVTVL